MTFCPLSCRSWKYRRPACSAGVVCIPYPSLKRPYRSWALNFHTSFPSKSKQATSPVPKKYQTCLPSVDGDGEALLPSSAFLAIPAPLLITFRHISFPSALTHIARSWFDASALVRKMRFPQTHGVELPIPGRGSFHTMFFDSLHSPGRFFSSEMPSFFGPRHCGQLSAIAGAVKVRHATTADRRRFMRGASERGVDGGFPGLQG